MTIQVKVSLNQGIIPLDYRRLILHFLKAVLASQDEKLFEEYYSNNSTKRKPFTFWAKLPKAQFTQNEIIFENKEFSFFVSSNDTKLSFVLYNGLKTKKKFSIGEQNFAIVKHVGLKNEKQILEDEIIVNMLSPLVVRHHEKGKKDRYILYNEDGFFDVFKTNVLTQLSHHEKIPEIEPIKCKKVVVKAFGTNIPSTLGVFKLTGQPEVLQKLSLIGIGSKNSAGFGKFEVIG